MYQSAGRSGQLDFLSYRSSRRTEAEDERWMDDWEEERYSDRYYSDRHEQKTGKRRLHGEAAGTYSGGSDRFCAGVFMGRSVRSLAGSLFGAGNVNVTGDSILPEADALLGKKTAAVKDKADRLSGCGSRRQGSGDKLSGGAGEGHKPGGGEEGTEASDGCRISGGDDPLG